MNKICKDLDAAIKRARSTAAPINAMRFAGNTPCKIDGKCHDCKSPRQYLQLHLDSTTQP